MDQSIHATGRSSSPINASQSAYQRARSRTPPPRPTTPLRPPSRSSLRSSSRHRPVGLSTTPTSSTSKKPTEAHEVYTGPSPLDALEPAFAELADGMADLEANLMHVQIMHESIARFNENFAGFLHGLRLNAFCVDFPEAPVQESFRRARERAADAGPGPTMAGGGGAAKGKVEDVDQTFLCVSCAFFIVQCMVVQMLTRHAPGLPILPLSTIRPRRRRARRAMPPLPPRGPRRAGLAAARRAFRVARILGAVEPAGSLGRRLAAAALSADPASRHSNQTPKVDSRRSLMPSQTLPWSSRCTCAGGSAG